MNEIDEESGSLLSHGLTTCAGCVMELAARTMLDVLGKNTIMLTPPSCSAILTGYGVETGLKVPAFQSNLENVAAYCSGIRVGLEVLGRENIHVVAFAGDGGTADIGLQALSAAIERGDKFIYVCYDNEAYMNTGIQRSSCTPLGSWTTTTPGGKTEGKKDIVAMLMAQGVPYLATASAGYISDFRKKIEKAATIDGPVYIHVLIPCFAGWRFEQKNSVVLGKLAVDTRAWPLFEVENGCVRITRKVSRPKPLEEYLAMQGRFRSISGEDVERLKADIEVRYNDLLAAAEGSR